MQEGYGLCGLLLGILRNQLLFAGGDIGEDLYQLYQQQPAVRALVQVIVDRPGLIGRQGAVKDTRELEIGQT